LVLQDAPLLTREQNLLFSDLDRLRNIAREIEAAEKLKMVLGGHVPSYGYVCGIKGKDDI
jgi:hypothetical protein